jgi:hypothetical protein
LPKQQTNSFKNLSIATDSSKNSIPSVKRNNDSAWNWICLLQRARQGVKSETLTGRLAINSLPDNHAYLYDVLLRPHDRSQESCTFGYGCGGSVLFWLFSIDIWQRVSILGVWWTNEWIDEVVLGSLQTK